MERCPNCKTEILFAGAAFCEHCGVSLAGTAGKSEDSDDLRMEVTEASAETTSRPRPQADDDLGIRSGSALVTQWQDDEPEASTSPTAQTGKIEQPPEPAETVTGVKKLSSNEVKTIEQKLYPTGKFITDDEKQRLIQNMSLLDSGKVKKPERVPAYRPGSVAATDNADLPKPTMAKRGRGLAYFYRNFVQFSGETDFREHDEITVNERTYTLRRKKLNPRIVTGGALSAAAVLAVAVIALLVRGTGSGHGRVVGLVLDEYNRPFAYGATVNFPDLDVSVKTNGQGFFVSDEIPAGSHKIEYRVNDQVVGTDYATVASGDMTTLTIRPSLGTEQLTQVEPEPVVEPNPAPVQSAPAQPVQRLTSPTVSRTQAEHPSDARLTLAANVEGARLSLDGTVTGAGNLTYTRLKPGQHRYSVSKEGYETISGIVNLAAGENTRLEVELRTAEVAAKPAGMPPRPEESPLLLDAQQALRDQQYETALGRFDQLIANEPNLVLAYVGRSETHAALSNSDAAYNDLVQAAEISASRGDNRSAITYYHRAIGISDRRPVSFLGRGRLYLQQGEAIAAVADFETVTTLDRRNVDAYVGLGEARFSQGNYKQSIKHFKDALNADSKNATALEYLMLAYMATDDIKNVKKAYDRYAEVASQDQLSRLSNDNRFVGVLRIVNVD